MLEVILPAGVESEECFGDPPGGRLFPEEEKIIAHAVTSRRRDFAAVRSCAPSVMARIGIGCCSAPKRRCTKPGSH
jgi:4'-phosphopantetheinyl transferase EntD